MKRFNCRDLGMNCDYEMRGNTDEDIFRQASEHGSKSHGIKDFTMDLKEKIRSKIQEIRQ